MILNTKTFYAVGQGGFYSERIYSNQTEYTIVYDCGSIGSKPKLVHSINNSGLERVDCIVISHLDSDHINGLKDLQSYLNKVSSDREPLLVLPKPTPVDLLIFFANASDQDVDTYFHMMECKNILFVTNENIKEDPIALDAITGVKTLSHNAIFTFLKSSDKSRKWLLKFYVDASKYQNKLTKRDIQVINSVKTFSDFEKKKKELADIYRCSKNKLCKLKKIRKKQGLENNGDSSEMNLSSMAMISAPQKKSLRNVNCKCGNNVSFISWLNGDIRLKNEEEMLAIETHFKDFLSSNIDFQVPHHGSHNNFSRLPKCKKKLRAYLWAGAENTHGHPSGTVLRKIQKENIEFHWITEEDNHIIRQEIWV